MGIWASAIKSSTSNTNISDLFFLCSARCSSGVESFSGRTTISVEKSKKAQLVRMKGKVRWGRPSTLGSHMRKADLEAESSPEEVREGSLGSHSGDNGCKEEWQS